MPIPIYTDADDARASLLDTRGVTRAQMRSYPLHDRQTQVAAHPIDDMAQPTPRVHRALYGLLLILAGVVMIVDGVRRMRPESKMALAAIIVVPAVLIVAGRVG